MHFFFVRDAVFYNFQIGIAQLQSRSRYNELDEPISTDRKKPSSYDTKLS